MGKQTERTKPERNESPAAKRFKQVVMVSIVGIAVNLALGTLKIIVGTAANSVAVISDAVNNFSDSISSIVTIITMAIVGKGATRKHPFGFGRMEYFSSIIISVLVLVTGGEFLISSVRKILHPSATSYSVVMIVLLAVAVAAKVLLGLYTKKAGKKHNSPNLTASGQDALSDAVITGVTLLGAVVSLLWPSLRIDGWIGAAVSLFVLKAGLEMVFDVISKLMGDRPSVDLADSILEDIKKTPGIQGAYDLILHNYGPNIYIGNVNVELEGSMTVQEAYTITKPLNIRLFRKYGVFVYFGFYAVNTLDPDIAEMRDAVNRFALSREGVLQMHAFYVDRSEHFMSFDLVFGFECRHPEEAEKEVRQFVREQYPEYRVEMTADKDYTLTKD